MSTTLRIGMAGLGGAARSVVPAFDRLPDVELTAVADIRESALNEFRQRYGVKTFMSVAEMCASPDVDAVWVATPNACHAEHAIAAAENGKHVICEKPMALSLEECEAMISAVDRNGVKYVQGHSKAYDPPVRRMRQVVASGELGRVIQITSCNYKSWLSDPRLEAEVDTATGGGVLYRQGPHQTDVVRCIGGGLVRTVRAVAGRWEPNFPRTEGNYTAFLEFEDGTPAVMVFNGYGYFSMTELTWGIGEGGKRSEDPGGAARTRMTRALEPDEKYVLHRYTPEGMREREEGREFQPFYGLTLVSCERGDLRQSPQGLFVYTEEGRTEVECDAPIGHAEELEELYGAVTEDRPSFPDARWGMATLEVCLAIMKSSAEQREIRLSNQAPCPL